ncbi:MAG: GNAT family N-acetyltransferase [Comamonas sp.]
MTNRKPLQSANQSASRAARMWRVALASERPHGCGTAALRQVCLQDAAPVAALARQAFLGGPDEASEDVLYRKVSAILEGSYGRFIPAASFVHASADGAIDAAILVTDYPPYGAPVVALIVVAKRMRQWGIGTALVCHSLGALRQQGHTGCCARITTGNLASERLFQVCGFAPGAN